jgi:nucleoside-diphosphate-sugar epimerase
MTKVDCEILGMIYWQKYGVDVRGIRYPGLISWKSPVSGGTTDYAVDIFHSALSPKKSYNCFLRADTKLPMMYMEDAIRATITLMNQPIESLSSARCGYNISGLSFTAEELSSEITNHIPGFICNYQPDIRQNYADSWPDSVDDEVAKNDWEWEPEFQLETLVKDMIENLTK